MEYGGQSAEEMINSSWKVCNGFTGTMQGAVSFMFGIAIIALLLGTLLAKVSRAP